MCIRDRLDPYCVVLEVKYNGFLLDYLRELINSVDRSELSVSKYVLARQNGCQTRLEEENTMRQQILNLVTTPRDMSWEDILLNIVLAAVLGFFIFLSYAISQDVYKRQVIS